MLVSVSFLKNKIGDKETISLIDKSNADYVHVDIMDGIFVPNRNFTYDTIREYFIGIKKDLDIHLMVKDNLKYVKDFVKLNPKYISFHIESCDNVDELIDYIKSKNIKVGIALKPETRVYDIIPYLSKIDMVLVMSVNPGAGGQSFINDVLPKIRELNALKAKYKYIISIDGGVNFDTVKLFKSDMIVCGSYVTLSDDYNKSINRIKSFKG